MFRLIIPVGTSRASWAVSRRTFNWSCWWLILSSSLMISRWTCSTAWFNSFVFSIKLESTHFTDSMPFSKMKRSCHKYILFVYNFQFQASMIELSDLIALQYTWKKKLVDDYYCTKVFLPLLVFLHHIAHKLLAYHAFCYVFQTSLLESFKLLSQLYSLVHNWNIVLNQSVRQT